MNSNDNIFLRLLSSYINGCEILPSDLRNTDWNYIYHMATIHNVVGIIYTVINKNKINIPEEISKKMQQAFFATTMYSVKQEQEAEKLLDLLNEKRIWHLVSKGYVIKKCYPDKELRTMGDIDVLVGKDDQKIVKEVLNNNEFKKIHEIGSECAYIKNDVVFEIHTSLMDENLGGNFDYRKYFDEIIECGTKMTNRQYTYELIPEVHFVYLIVHLAKHFFDDGCGVRMFMDIFVFAKQYVNEINWNNVQNILNIIKLKKFANNVWYLCLKIFDLSRQSGLDKVWMPKIMDEKLYEQVKNYVLRGGVFGFEGHDMNMKIFRQPEVIREDGDLNKKWKFILKWVFPDYEKIKKNYVWFKNKPIWFMPLGWVVRIIDNILFHPKNTVNKFKFTLKDTSESQKEFKMIKEMGLYNKEK